MKPEVRINQGQVAVFALNLEWSSAEVEDEADIKTGCLEIIDGLHFRAKGQILQSF